MYVTIHMKKNWQISYIFFNTQTYNLFVKKNVKILSFITKEIGTQSDDAHVHPCERQG
jgi:hypothetical protein